MKNIKIIHTFLIIFAIVLLVTFAIVFVDEKAWLVEGPLEIF